MQTGRFSFPKRRRESSACPAGKPGCFLRMLTPRRNSAENFHAEHGCLPAPYVPRRPARRAASRRLRVALCRAGRGRCRSALRQPVRCIRWAAGPFPSAPVPRRRAGAARSRRRSPAASPPPTAAGAVWGAVKESKFIYIKRVLCACNRVCERNRTGGSAHFVDGEFAADGHPPRPGGDLQ